MEIPSSQEIKSPTEQDHCISSNACLQGCMRVFSHLYMCRGLKKPFWHSDPVPSDTRVPRLWKLLELCHWIQIRVAHSEQNILYLFFFLQCYRSKMANAIRLRSHLQLLPSTWVWCPAVTFVLCPPSRPGVALPLPRHTQMNAPRHPGRR